MSKRIDQRYSDAVWQLAHDLYNEEGGEGSLWKQPKRVVYLYKSLAHQQLMKKFLGEVSDEASRSA